MNKRLSIFLFLFWLVSFSACEKVIEFDLSDSKPVVVIEAIITNKQPFTVLVSKTSPYFGTKTDNFVSGAKVSVRIEGGKPVYFKETVPGVYQLDNIRVSTGYWYIVDVECEGIVYSARSFMNETVPIVNLSFSYFDGYGILDSGYKVNTFFNDPAGKENYYRLKYSVNNKPADDRGEISIYSDKLFDGKLIGLGHRSTVFNETDTLTIELQSIDAATYNYFLTLESISGNGMQQTASPTNPTSNFNNGALGYFSAYSFDQRTVVISDFIKNK